MIYAASVIFERRWRCRGLSRSGHSFVAMVVGLFGAGLALAVGRRRSRCSDCERQGSEHPHEQHQYQESGYSTLHFPTLGPVRRGVGGRPKRQFAPGNRSNVGSVAQVLRISSST